VRQLEVSSGATGYAGDCEKIVYVITGRDLTPQQRKKWFHYYRFQALGATFFGIVIASPAIFAIVHGRRGFFAYAMLVFGAAWLTLARFQWSRARRYRDRA
jgi:hypothetical protein